MFQKTFTCYFHFFKKPCSCVLKFSLTLLNVTECNMSSNVYLHFPWETRRVLLVEQDVILYMGTWDQLRVRVAKSSVFNVLFGKLLFVFLLFLIFETLYISQSKGAHALFDPFESAYDLAITAKLINYQLWIQFVVFNYKIESTFHSIENFLIICVQFKS